MTRIALLTAPVKRLGKKIYGKLGSFPDTELLFTGSIASNDFSPPGGEKEMR